MKNFIALSEGQKVWFEGERMSYTIKAADKRFAVCTKPFNARHTVLYTIIDQEKQIRGTENLIFCQGFETDFQCKEALQRLTSGETKVSHRNYVKLNIKRVK